MQKAATRSAQRRWPDKRVATYLRQSFAASKVNREMDMRKAVEASDALWAEMESMRHERCEVGAQALNAAMRLLGDWRMPKAAEELLGHLKIPPDHETHVLLMQAFAKVGDSAGVDKWRHERHACGFPPSILAHNAYLASLKKPAEAEMRRTLQDVVRDALAADARTAKNALDCCSSVATARKLYASSFQHLLPARDAESVFIKIAARTGDAAFIEASLSARPERPTTIQLNLLLNAYAESGSFAKCLSIVSTMLRKSASVAEQTQDSVYAQSPSSSPVSSQNLSAEGAPSAVTFATAIKACVNALERPSVSAEEKAEITAAAESLFESAARARVTGNQHVFTKLMEVYGRVGDAAGAEHLKTVVAKCRLPMSAPMKRYYHLATRREAPAPTRHR